MRAKLFGWLGLAGFEAVARLAVLTLGTAAFSRLLSPQDFGVSALALIVATVGAVFVGAPFEDAIAQRRVLRRRHLEHSLGAAMVFGLALTALSWPLGLALSRVYGEPSLAALVPAAMAANLFVGLSDIITGVARRLRRFNDVAVATLVGNTLGTLLAVGAAFLHFGVWSLILQRVLTVSIKALVMQARVGIWISPRWGGLELDGIGRFARVSLGDRLMDNLTFLAFNNLVGYLYGVNALGFVNMAMRFVEPIRGAFLATGHNLAFYFFASLQADPPRLAGRAERIVGHAALAAAPVFAGLAAVAPLLLPLAAGPGWEPAIPIAIGLSVGSAIYLPSRLVFTALSAMGKPQYSLGANVAGMLTTLAFLVAAAPLGPVSVGLSRIAGDLAQAAIAILSRLPFLAWPRARRLHALAPGWALSAAMGLAVFGLGRLLGDWPAWAALAASVAAGIALYGALAWMFARAALGELVAMLPGRGGEL